MRSHIKNIFIHRHRNFMHSTDRLTSACVGNAHGGNQDNIRVLFLVSGYPSRALPTHGIFLRTLAEAISNLGVHIEIAAPVPYVPSGFARFSEKWKRYGEIPGEYRMNGVQIHSPLYLQIPHGDVWSVSHYFMERAAISCINRPPDIIHAHYAYPAGVAALALGKAWGVPAVLTLHGSDVHTNPALNRLTKFRFNTAVRGADYVTTVSDALAGMTHSMSGHRPEVIPIGVSLHRYERLPNKRAARKRLGLPMDRKLVLFVGALEVEKGVRELIRALTHNALSGVRGVFVGEGPLKDEAARHASILCPGIQPNEMIPLFMRACDMIALPSYGEGMPTVLVEAGAAGLPIIASRAGGIPELLGGGRGLLLDAISEDELHAKIQRILDGPDEAKERSEKMKSFIHANYDAHKNAAVYIERYRTCIEAYQRR
jgi:teichuronic acid biosynthesis glycosyltransferase TuaC